MSLINAIYEGGVFRPLERVDLPDGTTLQLQVPSEVLNIRALAPPGTDESLIRVSPKGREPGSDRVEGQDELSGGGCRRGDRASIPRRRDPWHRAFRGSSA